MCQECFHDKDESGYKIDLALRVNIARIFGQAPRCGIKEDSVNQKSNSRTNNQDCVLFDHSIDFA